MKIGTLDLGPRPVLLAPMEDVTDIGFRLLCRRLGASMVYSEFVAADALVRMVSRSLDKLTVCPEERPVAIQIYGRDPIAVRDAAQIVVERARPDVLDLNFGCPVKRVAGKGAGAGMLQNVPLMLDINEPEKIAAAIAREKPQVLLHAAAYKHLPMCELNPDEAWRNNARATEALVRVAKEGGVADFVFISTDKAVNPSSVMGSTKLAAETAVVAAGYTAVRFGNVLGSSGSVVPKWERQIANGGPVTVTDRRMTRYFMTVQEAVSLVLVAATMERGNVYTLDMGRPVSLVSLAEEMIRRAGYRPYRDIAIEFTGIRPGEKLSEELGLEKAKPTNHAKIYMS